MDIRLQQNDTHLHVEARGAYDGNAARAAIVLVRDECARLRLDRVLVDARGLDASVTIADRFDLARVLAEGCTAAVRFAILVRPEQMVTKTLEDSAVNRGVPVRTTAVAAEAYGFLGVDPPG
ncbi:hypothetical protein LDC_2452 [sediment metagenome]|uniref:STAS domain-containing protein n=1 Tax=sediment metagenome TaxID=749907 RepID=D9PLM9_9ZZZZ